MTCVAPGVFRRRREVSEEEELVNEICCGMPWDEAQTVKRKLLVQMGLRMQVEEEFREAQRKARP